MEYFVYHINYAKECFGEDLSLSNPRQISLWSKQFLNQIINQKGFIFNTAIECTAEGKPFFVFNPNLHFSISHTKEYIAIAISNKPIGIDIEQERKYKKEIVERFFHPKEAEYLNSLKTPLEQNQAFTKIWTLKESYVKCTGEGIANNFKSFYISFKDDKSQINNNGTPVKIQAYYNEETKIYIAVSEKLNQERI
ncbi:MAG: 4'-phosphopantetheinyl transferase superfamily protein [Bacteroidales bacterium]|nr:4'-phosphopantetheinyl transferase superfamily protein [Bacteroidales bacterium]MDD4703470.1 4'-phosphopantetheinyl transferase superfamily protein [Bacteroidales bacterium]MDX9797516.1 4'-phosphopantetheinyl transferase superfamily protein [Bacteroidales bacterium]